MVHFVFPNIPLVEKRINKNKRTQDVGIRILVSLKKNHVDLLFIRPSQKLFNKSGVE